MSNNETIHEGEALRKYLEDNKLGVTELANLLGVTRQAVYYQFNNRRLSTDFKENLINVVNNSNDEAYKSLVNIFYTKSYNYTPLESTVINENIIGYAKKIESLQDRLIRLYENEKDKDAKNINAKLSDISQFTFNVLTSLEASVNVLTDLLISHIAEGDNKKVQTLKKEVDAAKKKEVQDVVEKHAASGTVKIS